MKGDDSEFREWFEMFGSEESLFLGKALVWLYDKFADWDWVEALPPGSVIAPVVLEEILSEKEKIKKKS